MTSPALLADMVANLLDIKNEDKQDLLETFDLKRRLDKVLEHLGERVGVLRISKEIGDKTKKEFDERQREHVLREQMRQIQKELGEGDDTAAELEELKKAIEDAGMPEDVHKHAVKELKRLQRMGEGSAEGSMLRTYLEWLAELPWKEGAVPGNRHRRKRGRSSTRTTTAWTRSSAASSSTSRCASSTREGKSPILCFVGPPGVGKTSLGQSIARATGRKFQRIALGGVHDEAEIRGHRRTYIGALPGNVIQAIRRAESRTCVLMFDEIDKLGQGGFHGDPSSALLEVLDPEQNSKFRDNYLGGGLRPVEGHVHHHREHARHHPGPAARPHGDHPAARLHRGGEARDRQALPGEAPARGERPGFFEKPQLPKKPFAPSSPTTRARPACARSSARSARCCGTWR